MAGVDDRLGRLLDEHVRLIPDFPVPGVLFRDIGPALGQPAGLATIVAGLAEATAGSGAQVIAGVESRGFLLGAPLALHLGLGFVALRKAGRLPPPTWTASYALEYGTAVLEVSQAAITPGARVLVVDDVLATGGTAGAAVELVRRAGGIPVGIAVLLELTALGGRGALRRSPSANGVPVVAVRRIPPA